MTIVLEKFAYRAFDLDIKMTDPDLIKRNILSLLDQAEDLMIFFLCITETYCSGKIKIITGTLLLWENVKNYRLTHFHCLAIISGIMRYSSIPPLRYDHTACIQKPLFE